METTEIQAGGQLTGQVLFYRNPEPLSPQQHATLGVQRNDTPYAFAAGANAIPLTVAEFPAASLTYPIIFVGDERLPIAATGVRPGENLFIGLAGEVRPDAYMPAFARRYPFVFANDADSERMILCIDRGAAIVTEGGEVPLFENGQPSEYLQNAMKFCNEFEQERARTLSFVKLLGDFDLLAQRETVFNPINPDGTPGVPQKIAEYWAVDEAKLMNLPAEQFIELRNNGALTHIYAHLISLNAWDKLIAMAFARQATEAAPVYSA